MNDWLRLWHDMPTDPKWRTIARKSKQSIGNVMSVFIFMLVNASENDDERGRISNFDIEDIATALDIDDADVAAIMAAMEGKVINDGRLTGWDSRQPKREDTSNAERQAAYKERQRRKKIEEIEQLNHSVTQDNDEYEYGNNPVTEVTQGNASVTQGNASVTHGNASVTHGNAGSRKKTLDKIREDKNIDSMCISDQGEQHAKPDRIDPITEAVSAWNDMAKKSDLSPIRAVTDKRVSQLRARLNEHGLPAWHEAIAKIGASDFAKGKNNTNWKADFDFLIAPTNFAKVIEGKYDNKGAPRAAPGVPDKENPDYWDRKLAEMKSRYGDGPSPAAIHREVGA